VETIYGPVLVIAGPGSGKTQLLSARIAHILQNTDYLPYNILCLTFTDNAAENMRKRLATMIGADAYKVAIHTFHSFGNEILNRFRYKFRQYDEAKTIDDVVASGILDTILDKLPWNDPYKPGYRASETIRSILGEIQTLKSGSITPSFLRLILEHNDRTIATLKPKIQEHIARIDSLSNKKDEKLEKIRIFSEITDMVQQMFINEGKIGVYDTF
jgi:DNA helicase-2/ATP-dependent DNA helicase PcrA